MQRQGVHGWFSIEPASSTLLAFAYLQDYVKQGDTGRVTAATNTCSIAAGLVGNLTTGALAQATGNYQAIFVIAIGLYFTSWLVFDGLLRGKQLQLSVLNSMPA